MRHSSCKILGKRHALSTKSVGNEILQTKVRMQRVEGQLFFFFEKETTRVGKRLFGLPQLLYKFDLPPLVRKSFFDPSNY